jgi:predicted ester cyclase
MNETAIRSLVDDLVSAWNVRDIDRFISYLDESVIWDDPAMLNEPAVGPDAVRKFCESVLRAFPDFSYRIREPICVAQSGTRCVVPWEITATHTGNFDPLGFAPTQQVITMQGVDVIEMTGMKVTRIETLFNVLPAFEQALRLKPFAESSLSRVVILWLQRCRACWLRLTTKIDK